MNNVKYASFGRRWAAHIIDTLMIMTLFFVFGLVGAFLNMAFDSMNNRLFSTIMTILAFIGIPYLIICYFWPKRMATPGKMIMNVSVVDAETLQPLSTKQSLIRYLGYIPSGAILCLGYLWMLWDKKNQTWHDKLANTVVIINQDE